MAKEFDSRMIIHNIPTMALVGITVFPNTVFHFDVGREISINALNKAMSADQKIFLVSQKEISVENPTFNDIYQMGTIARIKQVLRMPGGTLRVLAEGEARAIVYTPLSDKEYLRCDAYKIEAEPHAATLRRDQATLRTLRDLFLEYVDLAPKMGSDIVSKVLDNNDLAYVSDFIAQNIFIQHTDKQRVLEETDPRRKQELLTIASNCEWVPENPPRTFHEAIQAHWFTQAFARLEQKISSNPTNGRMDQLFWPYYQKDLAEGRIDEEGAIELFQCMWASMAQCLDLAITPYNKATHEGYSHWEAVTVGGQTRDGRDATNELSYIIMRSKRECPLHYPDLAARVHSRSPERFLTAVAEMIKQGCGFPKLLNDDEIIPLHLAKGAPLEDIYDYAASGCAEIRMPRVDTYTSGHAQMNFGAAVELVLYNGRMKKYGDELLTVETGDVRNFTTWEEFWQAYATQQNYLMRHAFMQQYHIIKARAQHFATPISDALHVLAMKECVDLHQDHHYEGGLDLGYFECLGYSTAIDSLSAVRKLVFDDKKLTMQELLDALECNFEGKEDVRKMLQSAPCYGNNDDYADSIGLEIDRLAQEFSKKYAPRLGIKCDFRMVPFTSHVPFGRVVSATPNGRKAWTPLSDGSSASHGADVNGPTAVLLSNFNSKNYNMFQRAARLLNIKFTPSCLAGKEGTRKLVSFIRAFVDLRLWHVQFNVVNRQTLVNAQKDPEKYRGLIVRIAGYSAYFTELSKDLQDDLIARTQHEQV